jgi:hypothetical protein
VGTSILIYFESTREGSLRLGKSLPQEGVIALLVECVRLQHDLVSLLLRSFRLFELVCSGRLTAILQHFLLVNEVFW